MPYFIPKFSRGIRNKYRREMPVFEMLTKDLGHFFLAVKNFVKSGFRVQKIYIFPHFPSRRSTIYRVASKPGYNLTNKSPKGAAVAVFWEYLTFREEYSTAGF